jgi:predicted CoA-substrate-specific enzyme activase
MKSIGVDIGSTSAKYVVMRGRDILYYNVIPTGWSSLDAADSAARDLLSQDVDVWDVPCVSTGYGRVSVPFADKSVTEITCHGKGADFLFGGERATVIDIGGQDTKIISVEDGMVLDFLMNDKCSAGTGRFLEVMANALGLKPDSLCELSQKGSAVTISSMCTVFAESEVISLIGKGVPKQDIAYGIVDSITSKVQSQCGKQEHRGKFYLTGGLCECPQVVGSLSKKLGAPVQTCAMARYAGAVGAALRAGELGGKKVKKHD